MRSPRIRSARCPLRRRRLPAGRSHSGVEFDSRSRLMIAISATRSRSRRPLAIAELIDVFRRGKVGRRLTPWRFLGTGRRSKRRLSRCRRPKTCTSRLNSSSVRSERPAVQHDYTVVQFEAVRSRAIPPAPLHGGGRGKPEICQRHSTVSRDRKQLLRQRCDARGFQRSTIEIISKRKVAPAFEPQKGERKNGPGIPVQSYGCLRSNRVGVRRAFST
jgi:hypothetical protein